MNRFTIVLGGSNQEGHKVWPSETWGKRTGRDCRGQREASKYTNGGEAGETYQNRGKLSLSSDSQYSSSISRSLSRGFFPSLEPNCDVPLRVIAGREDDLCLEEGSVAETAFFTSV